MGVWVAYGCLAEWCGVSMVEGKDDSKGTVRAIDEGMRDEGKGKCGD